MEKITYKVSKDDPAEFARGKSLTGGRPEEISGKLVVKFAEKHQGKYICMMYSNRPDLAALVSAYKEAGKKEQEDRDREWAEARAKEEAADAIEIEKMEKEIAALREKIPAGAISVVAQKVGNADGYPILQYTADGIEIGWQDIEVVGWASAIRPGATGAFMEECVCYILPEKLEEIKDRKREKEKKEEGGKAERKAKEEEVARSARITGVKQPLRTWITGECMNRSIDCSFDRACEYIMPDGSRKIEYVCCH